MDRMRGIVDILKEGDVTKPPLLYKYYAFNRWTQRIFKHNEIYFSSPESFNDPFDSKVNFIYEGTRTDRKRFIKEWSERSRPELSRKNRLDYEKRIRKQSLDLQSMAEGIQKNFIDARNRMGVFSMTEDKENILMWSHYAAEHTGFCIELRIDKTFFSRARRVEYGMVLPCLNLLDSWDKLIKHGVEGLLTKAQNWAYEKEWRIIVIDGVGTHEYPSDALESVILGCRMSQDNKNQVKEWCRACRPKPTLYEAKEKEQEFGLDIIPISC